MAWHEMDKAMSVVVKDEKIGDNYADNHWLWISVMKKYPDYRDPYEEDKKRRAERAAKRAEKKAKKKAESVR